MEQGNKGPIGTHQSSRSAPSGAGGKVSRIVVGLLAPAPHMRRRQRLPSSGAPWPHSPALRSGLASTSAARRNGIQVASRTSPSSAWGVRLALVRPNSSSRGGKAPAHRWDSDRRSAPSRCWLLPWSGGAAGAVRGAPGACPHSPTARLSRCLTLLPVLTRAGVGGRFHKFGPCRGQLRVNDAFQSRRAWRLDGSGATSSMVCWSARVRVSHSPVDSLAWMSVLCYDTKRT